MMGLNSFVIELSLPGLETEPRPKTNFMHFKLYHTPNQPRSYALTFWEFQSPESDESFYECPVH